MYESVRRQFLIVFVSYVAHLFLYSKSAGVRACMPCNFDPLPMWWRGWTAHSPFLTSYLTVKLARLGGGWPISDLVLKTLFLLLPLTKAKVMGMTIRMK